MNKLSLQFLSVIRTIGVGLAILAFALGLPALGQEVPGTSSSKDSSSGTVDTPSSTTNEEGAGRVYGNYRITQSITFGGRIADFSGNGSLWSTFVNVRSGPRLLENNFDMRSLQKQGTLFDEFSFHTFGFGGDPNNLTRVRLAKYRWYRFDAQFRRDRNFWDYDLLANPLNPATSNPNVPVLTSPHLFATVRRLWDYSLVLRPDSNFRVRLGYARNSNAGPSFSSVRGGTEALLFQNWRNTVDSYQGGFDWKFARRTSLSYDQYWLRYKGDTNWSLANTPYSLSNGTPVDLGLTFNTGANQPCTSPLTGAFATPTCNGYIAYDRNNNVRGSTPTEQLSFHSNYVSWLDVSARFNYSGGTSDLDASSETFQGLSSRTRDRQFVWTGPARNSRVNVAADLGVTIRVNERFRIINTFRWWDNRLPGAWDPTQAGLFGTSLLVAPNVFTPATCPAPYTAATCPQHSSNSGPDASVSSYVNYFGQDTKTEQVEFMYDFNRHVGGRVGYRYRNRNLTERTFESLDQIFYPNTVRRGACADPTIPLNPDGSCEVVTEDSDGSTTQINEHTGLFGLWLRPNDQWRIQFDLEFLSADKAFTRISPRRQQLYRTRVYYAPKPWAQFSVSLDLLEKSNAVAEINHRLYNRNYGASATFMPENGRWGLDLSYAFTDYYSQTNICYVSTPAPVGTLNCSVSPYLAGLATYSLDNNFGTFTAFVKPAKKLRVRAGYTVTRADGANLILNPLAPSGPLKSWRQQPAAGLEYEFHPNWTGLCDYNFQGYREISAPGPTAARNFRGNIVTLAIRYAF